jgi:N-methylhydantoinase A
MAQATRLMTVERGYDPREFAYVCFGGAGPVHAVDLAKDLDIPTVVVPQYPGLFSAFGMLVADQTYDFQLPVLKNLDELEASELSARAAELVRQAHATFRQSGLDASKIELRPRGDCRYLGQAEALTVDLGDGSVAALQAAFEGEHRRQWNFIHKERPITIANLRLQAVAPTAPVVRATSERARGAPKPHHRRTIHVGRERLDLSAFHRAELRFGHEIAGPGVIEEASSSLVFPAGWRVSVDAETNLIVKLAG